MKTPLAGLLAPLFALALLIAPGFANAAPPTTAQDRADIARVEEYLNNIRTMRAEFLQVPPSGDTLGGRFYLSRPGRLRFEYTAPKGNFVVADGYFIHLWDNKLKTDSQLPIGSTLAAFILRPDIRLSGDVVVTDIARAANGLAITLKLVRDPGAGELTLGFTDRPLELRRWAVVDAQGLETQVSLVNVEHGVALDAKLFRFAEPGSEQPRYN